MLYSFLFLIRLNSGLLTVETECGPISGTSGETSTFLGVPFATSPVGENRWQPPKPLNESKECPWKERLAILPAPMCVQANATLDAIDQSEDCLYLDIFTPCTSKCKTMKFPVAVFIHGGDLTLGGSYIPVQIPRLPGIVSVSINYRLNAFGFLSLEILSKNDRRGISGNYGFLDIIEALRWVQRNIEAFGGDPDRVSLYGQSSGGTATQVLIQSPLAKGLFHRAISMSGGARGITKPAAAYKFHEKNWLSLNKCNGKSNDTLLKCMYSLSMKEVAQISYLYDSPYYWGFPNALDADAIMQINDGISITSDRVGAFNGSGYINDIPVVFGTMMEEVDFSPEVDVINFTCPQWVDYLKSVFSDDLVTSIVELYNNDGCPMQLHYDRIAADIRVICPNYYIAQNSGGLSSFSMYVMNDHFEKPICLPGAKTCVEYAFHGLDLILLFDDRIDSLLHTFTDRDKRLMKVVKNSMLSFLNFTENHFKSFSDFGVNVITADGMSSDKNFKKEQCEFWIKHGYLHYGWSS